MKPNLSLAHLILTLCLIGTHLPSAFAQSGEVAGGGGTAVLFKGKLILTDLVEAGIMTPSLPDMETDPAIVEALRDNLHADSPSATEQLQSEILLPLAKKLTEIDQAAHPAGIYMASAFFAYEIHFVPMGLTNLDDVDSAIDKKVQVAERREGSIFINTPSWKKLDMVNKVALMTHEIIYAFQPLPSEYSGNAQQTGGVTPVDQILATSAKARFMNSLPNFLDLCQSIS